ncbi:MAG: GAF domain-containing protein [Candidatus Eiseniibacteriota bacterium]|nr:MAG: GAF domain-containing protein [Candidatus Eisenbacteria bacterium]
MQSTKRRVAIVGLREADLDVIPAVLGDERWELVSLADTDPSAAALRIAEIMKLPATANVASLSSLGVDLAICGSPEAERILEEVLGRDVATISPSEALGRGPEVETERAIKTETGVPPSVAEVQRETEPEPEPELEKPRPGPVAEPPPGPEEPRDESERTGLADVELGDEESRALGTLSETLNLALDRQKLLKWILELAIGCTGGESGSVMLLDEAEQQLRIAMAQGLSHKTIEGTRQPVGEGIAGKVVLEGRPLLISGQPEHDDLKRGIERRDVKAAMCVPLIAEGRPIGVLNVSSSRDASAFLEKDLHLLERLAERATQIIQKTLAYSDISSRTLEFTLREAVEEEMGRNVPFPEKVQRLADSLAERLEADCYFYLPCKEGEGTLSLFASSVKDVEPPLPRTVSGGRGFLGRAVASGKPQIFLPAGIESSSVDAEHTGIMCAPVRTGRGVGLLVFDSLRVSDSQLEAFVRAFERVGRVIGKELDRETSLLGLKEQAETLSELNQMAASVMAAQSVEEVVRIVAGEGVRLLKADVCLVTCEDGRSWFVDILHGSEGVEDDDELGKARELLTTESVKEMTFISSSTVDETLALELERLGVSSFIAGPLRAGTRFLGVCMILRMVEGKKRPFGANESSLFKSFCGYAAHGLQNTLVSVRAERFSQQDEETGLLGAEAILSKIEDEGRRYERYGIGFCVTVVEIEGLAAAFQRLGHEWRAAFLEEFCGGLRKGIREVDAVGRTAEATFVVVSPQTPREGEVILRRIEELLSRVGAVRYVSPAPELGFKAKQLYWPKDICDPKKARQAIADCATLS